VLGAIVGFLTAAVSAFSEDRESGTPPPPLPKRKVELGDDGELMVAFEEDRQKRKNRMPTQKYQIGDVVRYHDDETVFDNLAGIIDYDAYTGKYHLEFLVGNLRITAEENELVRYDEQRTERPLSRSWLPVSKIALMNALNEIDRLNKANLSTKDEDKP